MKLINTSSLGNVLPPPEEKARIFRLFGTVSSPGVPAWPIIGGALISADIADLSGRPVFLINTHFGVATLTALVGWQAWHERKVTI